MTTNSQTSHDAHALSIQVLSTAFHQGERIPARYTADGADVSPPLRWSNPPPGTRSLAIICDDPDARSGAFVHWLAWNIRPDQRHINEGVSRLSAPSSMCEGRNGFGREGYAGPNPPAGELHHYRFQVFALDTPIELSAGATRPELEQTMAGHVLAEGTLVGEYEH
jgi:Raf kinase inhibitor-like YbhB/YbcL family protein